jgi:precorrin-2 dehydrogenase/sirohydrochlorin ferrochelatase
MIPLFADLHGKRVVIFGGGKVALRKAFFFTGDADIEIVSRSHARAFSSLPVTCTVLDIEKASDRKIRDLVNGAFIVVSALPDKEQNNRIGRICIKEGILFNNADGSFGNLIVPSVSTGKQFTIAVTTHGKSPAVSRYVREHLDEHFFRLDEMIMLQDRLRKDLKKYVPDQKQRSDILWQVIRDPEIWEALARSENEAESIARRKYLDG